MSIDFVDLVIGVLMVGMTISVGVAAYQLSRPTVAGSDIKQNVPLRGIATQCAFAPALDILDFDPRESYTGQNFPGKSGNLMAR